jgi:hypothetical protein
MELDFDSGRTARLAILEQRGEAQEVDARVVSFSASGSRMVVASGLLPPPDTPVKVICPPYVILAEVCSTNEAEGTIVVRIRHVLKEDDLERIRSNWF